MSYTAANGCQSRKKYMKLLIDMRVNGHAKRMQLLNNSPQEQRTIVYQ